MTHPFKRSLLPVAVLFLVLSACSDSSNDTEAVATWQEYSVPEDLFVTEYVRYTSSAPVRDHIESRKEFARILLERDIIAGEARANGLDTMATVRQTIERSEELSLVKHYVRDQIEPSISEPTEQSLRDAFRRRYTRANLDHIYYPDEASIKDAQAELENGASFDSLAARAMERANQPSDSYQLGEVAWNQMDLSAEEAAFDLESGEISSPVRSSRGWHIFRLNNKEETFFADATTFDNARESLGFALERRQYEEIAPMYVDSVTAEIELVTQVGNLRELWNDLAPRLPNRRGELVAMLQREAAGQRVGDLPRSTPLAQVDGQAFTVGQFMKRLPNIPASQLGPDLRIALESAIKDSIFAARARLDGYMDHTDVIKDRRIASTEAYYRAYVNVVADTLQLEPIAKKWYSNWKERYAAFGDINMEVVAFSDSMEAQQALSRYLESRLTADLLSASDNKRSIVIDTVNTSADDLSPAHPALSLPDEQIGAADQPWWGPFKQHDSWTFIRVMSREVRYRDYEDVKVEHLEQMKRRFPEIVHQEILENLGYDPSEIDYNTGLIRESLPIYY